mgnify:CR=1 FL=1
MADMMTAHPQLAAFGPELIMLSGVTADADGLKVMAKIAEHPEVAAKLSEALRSDKKTFALRDLLKFLPFILALLRGEEIDWIAFLNLLNEILNPPAPGDAPPVATPA